MTFERQNAGGKFVVWLPKGKKNDKDNSYVVKEGAYLEGVVTNTKSSDKYGVIFEVKAKDCDDTLVLPASVRLKSEMGYAYKEKVAPFKTLLPEADQKVYRVKVGDLVRVHFDGMQPSSNGEFYDLWVEVDK